MAEVSWRPLSIRASAGLCCPHCHQSVTLVADGLQCTATDCGRIYSIVNNVPILIDEEKSLFSVYQYEAQAISGARRLNDPDRLKRWIPGLSLNLYSDRNFKRYSELLLGSVEHPLVLIIGGRVTGKGMEVFKQFPGIELISSDVAFGPRTQLISDAHDIPYKNGFFDGVIVQAVLEHVLDPYRCVAEVHRVLKPGGLVYAETPFMQQVHEGRYDFTRFTHLGHRRLFRWFEEIDSGPVGGPGMAMAWSIRYFILSFTTNRKLRSLLGGLSRFMAFFWKYFDPLLATKQGAYDAAAGFYFMGRKNEFPIPDREIIQQYRGAFQ